MNPRNALAQNQEWLLSQTGVTTVEVVLLSGQEVIFIGYDFSLTRTTREAILDRLVGCSVLLSPQRNPRTTSAD